MKNGDVKIPMIPGMIFDQKLGQDQKKSQKFVISQGAMIERQTPVLSEIKNTIKSLYLPMVTS